MIGYVQAPPHSQLKDLKPIISSKAGLASNEFSMDLLEELQAQMCMSLPLTHHTLAGCGLGNGDILIAVPRRHRDPRPEVSRFSTS